MYILNFFKKLSYNPWYWRLFIIGGLTLMAVALYHQYVLDEQPCVVCIQVRLLVTALILVPVVALLSRNNKRLALVSHLLIVVTAAVLTERSYLLLGTERGFIFADCGFDLGLPAWFAVEQWLPWLYRIETSCGYTPEVAFGITMAESLMVFSVCLLLFSSVVFIAGILSYKTKS